MQNVPKIDKIEQDFIDAVRAAREAKGWSQTQLAARMADRGFRWHQSSVARIEHGDRALTFREYLALADSLDMDWTRFGCPQGRR